MLEVTGPIVVVILLMFVVFIAAMFSFILIDMVLDGRLSRRLGRWFDRKFPEQE